MLRQKLACICNQSYMRYTSTVYIAINLLIPLWLSSRLLLPKNSATTLLKNTRQYQSCSTLSSTKAARSLTKTLKKGRKSINVWINSGKKVKKIFALPLLLVITAKLAKICSRLHTSTVTRIGTTQGTTLSQEKTCQKASISLSNLRSDD